MNTIELEEEKIADGISTLQLQLNLTGLEVGMFSHSPVAESWVARPRC